MLIFLFDAALFGIGLWLALWNPAIGMKLLGSALLVAGIVRLFLVGHDACHGSFFSKEGFNQVIGRLAFMGSLTPYSLWDVGHNFAHHGFSNLKGRDYVWVPFSKAEFDALPRHRRVLERIYRSGYGYGLYYLLELWWKKLFFPTKKHVGARRASFTWDGVLVVVAMSVWIGVVALATVQTGQPWWLLALFGLVLPFLLWNVIMGFIIFVHHTHPEVAWFDRKDEWLRFRGYLVSTLHVQMPPGIGRFLHNIMEHTAHHVNPRIPMFRLKEAQRALSERWNDQFVSYRLTWRSYARAVRCCKLYDYSQHAWLNFRGEVMAQLPLPTEATAA